MMEEAKSLADLIFQNKEWVFSGVGVAILAGLFRVWGRDKDQEQTGAIVINNTNTVTAGSSNQQSPGAQSNHAALQEAKSKTNTHILFVDDDTKFQIVKILRGAGWPHVKIVKDISALDSPDVLEADVLFIDIQGVGKSLKFSDEGLGLALALKKKHNRKKIVIYSAETKGERFHDALRRADSFLPKNAEPYEFIQVIEECIDQLNA